MIYTYECQECGSIEDRVYRLSDYPRNVKCVKCGGQAKKIITLGHGGIQRDEPVWLSSACKVLQRPHEPRLETRTEYKAYLKKEGLSCIG